MFGAEWLAAAQLALSQPQKETISTTETRRKLNMDRYQAVFASVFPIPMSLSEVKESQFVNSDVHLTRVQASPSETYRVDNNKKGLMLDDSSG